MAEKERRNFALRDKDGTEIGVFTGKEAQGCTSMDARQDLEAKGKEDRYREARIALMPLLNL